MTRTALLTLALLAIPALSTARADLIPSCPPGTHVERSIGPSGHPLNHCAPNATEPVAVEPAPVVDPAPVVEPTPAPVVEPTAVEPTPVPTVEPAPAPAPVVEPAAAPAASSGLCSVTHGGGSALFAGLTLMIAALALSRRR